MPGMRRAFLLVGIALLMLGGLAGAQPIQADKRLALVVGNGKYQVSPLRNPVNDARAIAVTLRAVGFEVILRENVTQKDLRRVVLEFGDRLTREQGVGLFYYAGHGVQVNGHNYMVPVDAVINSEAEVDVESVDVASVLARMETARNPVNIVILDACRDNPFPARFRSLTRGLASISAPTGTIIAYATAPGDVASDGDGQNSIYTSALARSILAPGVRVEDVFKRVRAEVRQRTSGRQVPWESSSLEGDFIFAAGRVVAAVPSPSPSGAPPVSSVPAKESSATPPQPSEPAGKPAFEEPRLEARVAPESREPRPDKSAALDVLREYGESPNDSSFLNTRSAISEVSSSGFVVKNCLVDGFPADTEIRSVNIRFSDIKSAMVTRALGFGYKRVGIIFVRPIPADPRFGRTLNINSCNLKLRDQKYLESLAQALEILKGSE